MDDVTRQDEAVQQEEKLVPQSKVDEIVKTVKFAEREKYQRMMNQQQGEAEAMEQAQPQVANQPQVQQQMQQEQQQQMQSQPQIDPDAIAQQALEQFRREQQAQQEAVAQEQYEREMRNVANDYYSKMSDGAKQFDDFDDIMQDFDPSEFPELVILATRLPNTAAIMRELNSNPSKLVTLNALAKQSGKRAESEIKKLSDSIAANEQAQAEARDNQTQPPLDRLQPNRVTGSNGKMSIRDLRADPYYRS